jgi:bleomycin hydrolase
MKKMLVLVPVIFLLTICSGQVYTPERLGLKLPAVQNCTSVKDQANSSTCWSFASNSFLESELKRLGHDVPDLSEMFVARYSYLRKIETHIRLKGGNFFTPGGQFHDVLWVMKNYGMMPQTAYPGVNGTEGHYNHSELDTVIKQYVAYLLTNNITSLQQIHYRYIDSVFDKHLGIVISNFTYKNRNYTPKSFLKAVLEINPDDYAEITSYTHHPFYTRYAMEDKYNWTGDLYYNVPIQHFSAITDNALRNGFTVCWDGDVTETGFDFYGGLAWLNFSGKNYQAERQRTLQDSTTGIDHMMHITAFTKDKKGGKWYCVKNSWGNTSNSLGGFMFMSEAYFRIKTSAIIVHKDAVPAVIRRKMGL